MDEPLLPGVSRVGKTVTVPCVGRRSFEVSKLSDGTVLLKLTLGRRPLAHPILTLVAARGLGEALLELTAEKPTKAAKGAKRA